MDSVGLCEAMLAAANLRQRLIERVFRDAEALEQLRGRGAAFLIGQREEQMLGARVLVLELRGFLLGCRHEGAEPRRQSRLRAALG